MPRTASSIQTEITALEAALPGLLKAASYGVNGRSKTNVAYDRATARLDQLYLQLGRANGTDPMVVRGRLKGVGSDLNGTGAQS